MAHKNVTRAGDTHEKKGICVMVAAIGPDTRDNFDAKGNFLVGYLPNAAVIQNAFVWTSTVQGAAQAITVGTAEGGAEILSAGDGNTAGKSGTFTGMSGTGTGVPIYVNLGVEPTVGVHQIVIEYLEYTKNTGELTIID